MKIIRPDPFIIAGYAHVECDRCDVSKYERKVDSRLTHAQNAEQAEHDATMKYGWTKLLRVSYENDEYVHEYSMVCSSCTARPGRWGINYERR